MLNVYVIEESTIVLVRVFSHNKSLDTINNLFDLVSRVFYKSINYTAKDEDSLPVDQGIKSLTNEKLTYTIKC